MNKCLILLASLVVLSACSRPNDVLENIEDVSVPDQLTGCVSRGDDGVCNKAVCVEDDENDCSAFVEACEAHEHIVDVRNGHDTCERRGADPES